MNKLLVSLIVIVIMYLVPSVVQAQVSCDTSRQVFHKTISLQGSDITVGADTSIGTVLYTGNITNQGDPSGESAMTCRYSTGDVFTFNHNSLLAGGGQAVRNGIYSTSLPGVGVRFYNTNTGSASGVDIQLRKGTVGNNSNLVLQQPYSTSIVSDGRSTLDVPLVARLVRNSEQLSPGRADGKVVYLINYK